MKVWQGDLDCTKWQSRAKQLSGTNANDHLLNSPGAATWLGEGKGTKCFLFLKEGLN
jgi:hypothetical protein